MSKKDVLQFEISVERTDIYTITRTEFEKYNKEFELGLDFDNLTHEDLYKLMFELDDSYITDINHRDCTVLDYEYFETNT